MDVFDAIMTVMNELADAGRIGAPERAYMYAVIRRIVRDDDAAADATQDALLLAHRHRDQFRGEAAHRTWLYRIAVTTALGHLRRQRRSRECLAPTDCPLAVEVADPSPSPEQAAATNELARDLSRALAEVAQSHRQVFLLRLEDWSESEIARRVGISVANVKIRAHRARARLRDVIPDHPINRRSTSQAARGRQRSRADRAAADRAA